MANTFAVAKLLEQLYREKHGDSMDQMRMHKMLYLAQRESLMVSGTPLFEDVFEAWKYGPVLVTVRDEYKKKVNVFSEDYGELEEKEKLLVESVFKRYDEYTSWELSTLSHAERSWLQARQGLSNSEAGSEKMRLSAMKVDATREFLRRKGVLLA